MTRSLRQKHRLVFVVLGGLLPVVFTIGISMRQSVPPVEIVPLELRSQTQTFTATGYERDDLFAKPPVKVCLWEDLSNGQLAVGFSAPKDFEKPDLLAYWVTDRLAITDKLPADAILLGSFASTLLALPNQATNSEGSLVLFSLADQEIVGVSKRVNFAGAKR
jgi:hypothetical protein